MNAIQPATPPLSQLALPHPEHRPGPRPQALGSATDTSPADELDNPAALKKAFAERCNWQALATVLRGLLKEAVDTGQGDRHRDVEQLLSGRTLSVCEDSDYYQQHPLPPARSVVDLRTYLNGSGLPVPTRMDDLLALYQLATRHAQTHPLGNFSGALSWPLPLNTHDRQTIIDLLDEPGSTLPGLPLAARNKGVLGYLLADSDLANIDLKKTSNATEALLGSARAQALGKVIQSRLGGIATPASVNDYLLAAIQLSLDPESLGTPARNSVAPWRLRFQPGRRDCQLGPGDTAVSHARRDVLDQVLWGDAGQQYAGRQVGRCRRRAPVHHQVPAQAFDHLDGGFAPMLALPKVKTGAHDELQRSAGRRRVRRCRCGAHPTHSTRRAE